MELFVKEIIFFFYYFHDQVLVLYSVHK